MGESGFRSVARWVCWYFTPEIDGLSPWWRSATPEGFPNKAGRSPPEHRRTRAFLQWGRQFWRRENSRGVRQASYLDLPPQASNPPAFQEKWLRRKREVESVPVLFLMETGVELSSCLWVYKREVVVLVNGVCCSPHLRPIYPEASGCASGPLMW